MCARPRANPPPSARPNVGRGLVVMTFAVELRLNSREKARTERRMRSRLLKNLPRNQRPMPTLGIPCLNTVTRSHHAATSVVRGVTLSAHSMKFQLLQVAPLAHTDTKKGFPALRKPASSNETMSFALVPSAVGMLTCAVTVICALREVLVYECDHNRAGKDLPVLRS